jgi:putative ABC transport system substrate-binding protein
MCSAPTGRNTKRSSVITAALARESRTIPIVFVLVSDPIGLGLVASQARPGGNVTGFLQVEDDLVGK